MKQVTRRDLFALTLVIALHLAICKLAVAFRASSYATLVLLAPTALTLWIHGRIGSSWKTGAVTHYMTSIVWAFSYGLTYSFFYIRREPNGFLENNSVGLEYPLSFAITCVQFVALLGIATSLLYGAVGYSLTSWGRQRSDVRSIVKSNQIADEP